MSTRRQLPGHVHMQTHTHTTPVFLTGPGSLTHTHFSHHDRVRLAPTVFVLCVGGNLCELAVLALQESLLRGAGLIVCVGRVEEEGNFRPTCPQFHGGL